MTSACDPTDPEETDVKPPSSYGPAADLSDYPGFGGWLLRHPIVTCSTGAIGALTWGVILLITNPAGISTSGDEYGPSAPLQGWVVILAVLCFVLSGLCIAMLVVIIRNRWSRKHDMP